jgi:phosphate transport system protein
VTLSSQANHSDRTHFDRALRRLQQDVLRMGTLVEQSFRLSHQCLFERKIEETATVTTLDREVDRYYRQIELDCATLMTLQAPVAQDLRMLSALMQLVRDLERIGDYAKDLTEMSVKLFKYSPHPFLNEIEGMSKQAQLMLSTSLVALAELDPSAGVTVKKMDDIVDDAYDSIYETLAQQTNIQGVVEPLLVLALVIRHLERMADHATNIAQRVSYIVTGQRG